MYIRNQIRSFQYLGGKYSCLPWLLPLLPESEHFVDVFGGSAVVLLNRPVSKIETYNDINDFVVNFFRVLRDEPDQLIRSLQLTLHSRSEYEKSIYCESDSSLEKARKFYIRNCQSLWAAGSQSETKGWGMSVKESRTQLSEKTHKWLTSIEALPSVIARFRGVQIDCKDFRYILSKYNSSGTLFYIDSPYDQTFRSSSKYQFDFVNQDFYDLHYYCKATLGKVAISGYDTPFMNDLFKDFNFHKGPLRLNSRSTKQAYECLWTNY